MQFSSLNKKKGFFTVGIFLLVLSLTLPAFYNREGAVYGIQAFFLGWTYFLKPLIFISWLSNVILLVLLIRIRLKHTTSHLLDILLGIIAIILALRFLYISDSLIIRTDAKLSNPKALYKIIFIGVGYYLWLASIAILTLGHITLFIGQKFKNKSIPEISGELLNQKNKDAKSLEMIAIEMLKNEEPLDKICKYTGLSIDQVEYLRKKG